LPFFFSKSFSLTASLPDGGKIKKKKGKNKFSFLFYLILKIFHFKKL
jgi:hypothetical protein